MKVLVMGGSRFNGLALVQELAAAGHDVSVVNRGQSGGDLPDGVRRLVADRTDHGRLGEVLAGQDFDCVHDVSAYHPEDVEVMIELLDGRVGHYVFVSSTVIYAATDILPITEDHPVDRSAEQSEYGLHKLLCEDLLLTAHHRRRLPRHHRRPVDGLRTTQHRRRPGAAHDGPAPGRPARPDPR